MARKSAAMLKSAKPKIGKHDAALLKRLERMTPEPGFEEQWERYLAAERVHAEETARYDALFHQVEREGGGSSAKTWPAFIAQGKRVDQTFRASIGSLDAYMHAVKHKDDKVNVPEDEVRGVLNASFSDKLDDLSFSVNYGILASKVAQAIRKDTQEAALDVPYCADHA